MTTTTQAQALTANRFPILGLNWMTNGCINPLIRTLPELREVAGEAFNDALRSARIHLDIIAKIPVTGDDETDWAAFMANRYGARGGWNKRKDILPGIKTTAQLLANHGNGHCRAECSDVADLARACALVGSYNEFDGELVGQTCEKFTPQQYYNENNPNNGRDLYKWFFGWEGSTVIYCQFITYGETKSLCEDWRHYSVENLNTFTNRMKAIARLTHADESDLLETDAHASEWRFWWD